MLVAGVEVIFYAIVLQFYI